MRSVGYWPASIEDTDEVTIDFGPNLGSATITGTPTVAGVDCTAAYVTHTAGGLVTMKVSAGTYVGEAQATIVLSDGRTIARSVSIRFL